MQYQPFGDHLVQPGGAWLKTYYFLRAGVTISWIVLAVLIGRTAPPVAAILLVLYPAWDGVANFLDARKNGGFRSNPSQAFNVVISLITTVGIAYALNIGMEQVLMFFGVWAILAGASQLVTGFRRWKTYGAQWVMILSGGQSVLVAAFFFKKAVAVPAPGIEAVIPYAALGAFYFLLSAIWLTVKHARTRPTAVTISCAECATPLYKSVARFDNDARWPNFWDDLPGAIETSNDDRFGFSCTDVRCSQCGGHLGHALANTAGSEALSYCMDCVVLTLTSRAS